MSFVVVVGVEEFEQLVRRVEELERLLREQQATSASPFMTISEAAVLLRSSRQRVDDLLSSGRLRRVKEGRRTLVRRADIETYLARHTTSRDAVRKRTS